VSIYIDGNRYQGGQGTGAAGWRVDGTLESDKSGFTDFGESSDIARAGLQT
jgi:hypothetical protein